MPEVNPSLSGETLLPSKCQSCSITEPRSENLATDSTHLSKASIKPLRLDLTAPGSVSALLALALCAESLRVSLPETSLPIDITIESYLVYHRLLAGLHMPDKSYRSVPDFAVDCP